jgi:hypothetical protein
MLERAAITRLVAAERASLRQLVDPTVIDAFHQRLQGGKADQILNELRGGFDDCAVTIDEAMVTLGGSIPTDMTAFVSRASAKQVSAWKALAPAAAVLNKIAAVATVFGPRGTFPMIRNPKDRDAGLELGWLADAALMCCDGDLRQASYAFQKPAPPNDIASSPWLQVRPALHSIAEATERLRCWVESDWAAREALRGKSGHLDENGQLVPDVRRNPHSLAVTR